MFSDYRNFRNDRPFIVVGARIWQKVRFFETLCPEPAVSVTMAREEENNSSVNPEGAIERRLPGGRLIDRELIKRKAEEKRREVSKEESSVRRPMSPRQGERGNDPSFVETGPRPGRGGIDTVKSCTSKGGKQSRSLTGYKVSVNLICESRGSGRGVKMEEKREGRRERDTRFIRLGDIKAFRSWDGIKIASC
ncbi:hypothetical protein KM043_006398 [Ampulex compressa]|nr:hypothetical protein KM043_006398 [Ampulex compressa]